MKTKRFRNSYRKNSSKLHRRVGDVLKESSLFSGFKIYQEYPVNRINLEYDNGQHAFDWVVLDMHLVIEVHGEQHYKPVTFGGVSHEEASERFVQQRHRDNIKAQAAIDAGFTYIVIPYTDYDKVSDEYIWRLYKECFNDAQIPKKEQKVESEWDKQQKIRAREYRKEQYQRQKEFKRRIKNDL